ncbi:MAG: alpha/beta hydrolase [Solirubrobacteraceae bacterium]
MSVPRALARAVVLVALAAIGLLGAYRYWESYYVHRGFAPVAYVPHAHPGRLETVHFYSTALHREADYLVSLPPGYRQGSRRRYPVYYLLHGSPGRPAAFLVIAHMPTRMSDLIAEHRMRAMILVLPDGRIGGSSFSDSEWANTPSGAYASYVVDVVHDVDRRFDTLPNRQDRVIAGLSMGAYGATNIALHNLGLFGNLQSWSGYYRQTRSGVFANADAAALRANSPIEYVSHLRRRIARYPVRAFLFCGRDDDSSVQVQPMASALAAAGGRVSWALYPGGHDWQLWDAHLDQMLELASRDTTRPLRPSSGSARSLTPGVTPIPHGKGSHRRGRTAQRPARRSHHRRGRARRRGRRRPLDRRHRGA